jgi:hypothetical protein
MLLTRNCIIFMIYSRTKSQKASGNLFIGITHWKPFLISCISSLHRFCHPDYGSVVDCGIRLCLTTLPHSPRNSSFALSLTNILVHHIYGRHVLKVCVHQLWSLVFIGLPATKPSDVTISCAHVLSLADLLSLKKVSV